MAQPHSGTKKITDQERIDQPINNIYRALPHWPNKTAQNDAYWVGLAQAFSFSHHPADSSPLKRKTPKTSTFCEPYQQVEQLVSILEKSKGGSILVTGYRGCGKSSLVYRSLEKFKKSAKGGETIEFHLNLSSPRNGAELAKMVLNGLHQEKRKILALTSRAESGKKLVDKFIHLEKQSWVPRARAFGIKGLVGLISLVCVILLLVDFFPNQILEAVEFLGLQDFDLLGFLPGHLIGAIATGVLLLTASLWAIWRRLIPPRSGNRIAAQVEDLWKESHFKSSATRSAEATIGAKNLSGSVRSHREETIEAHPLELHDLQTRLKAIISEISKTGTTPIFVFDELDKLTPQRGDDADTSIDLIQLKQIVSDLKFLLTEASAHYIFVAGKDADDSWQEDQNKGEGILESVFVTNIYVPSLFTSKLAPTLGPNARWFEKRWQPELEKLASKDRDPTLRRWTRELVDGLIKEIGIDKDSWGYNTATLNHSLPRPLRDPRLPDASRVKSQIPSTKNWGQRQ